jgi:hypothetical protein
VIACACERDVAWTTERAALTSQSSAWGFEVLWTASAGNASLSTVVAQGQRSLQLDGFTFTEVTSPAVVVPPTTASSVGFDLWIPTPPANLNWFGGVNVFVSCPAQNVNHAFVGYQDLLPFPQATFATIAIPLPANLPSVFQAGCSNMQIGIALSVAGGSPYRLDNFRVNPVSSPPTASILGMERTLDWSPSNGTLASSTQRTEGRQGLAASGFTFAEIRSAPVKIVGLQSHQIGFDVMVPALPAGTWPGQTLLYLSAPSRALNHAFVGQVPLDGFVAGRFQTASFTITDTIFQALQGTVSDLSVSIGLNVALTSSTHRLDNVRFGPALGVCAHSDGFVPTPGVAAWQTYDTTSPAGSVTTTSGKVTLTGRGTGFASGGDGILSFYQSTTGDFDATVNVDVPATAGATAGLLLYSQLTPTSPFVFVGTSAKKLAFVRRTTSSQVTTTLGAATSGTIRVRLVKAGLTVAAYSSADGVTWNTLGAATLPAQGQLNIGVAAASGSASVTATSSFSGFQLLFANGCGRCGDGG